ncbi:MAG: ATP-binding protein [Candidatus Marinimicrobia bacterium]|nr:ATP-binding protein [Candidatus Neomarinimicrobiota bacterium]
MILRIKYIDQITPFIGKPVIKVITGMRRIGKSTFLKMIMNTLQEQGIDKNLIVYINKESLEFDDIQNYMHLNRYITAISQKTKKKLYIFIDEIQEISEWEKAILSFFSNDVADIYISGSNAHLFSEELATLLSGRYVTIPIYPLTFKEFLLFRGSKIENVDNEKEFSNYVRFGGFPGIHMLDFHEEIIFQYINSIFNTILLKDVTKRHKIRNVAQLERITKFIFDNCGNIISAKKISDYLKSQRASVTVDTIQNFLQYLQSAFLIFKTSRFDIKGKRHLEFLEKYYMGDIGLRHGFIGYRDSDISGILENIVYLELLSRGYKVSVGKLSNLEIDFIAEQQGNREYFQVCYLLASKDTENREFKPLELLKDNFPKTVISLDKNWGNNRNGILRSNLIEWLMVDD